MAVLTVSHEQTTKMYQQLLNLLEEMMIQAGEEDPEENADETGLIQSLVEEAEERGMDEELTERIFKMVSLMRRKAREQ